MIRHLPPDFEAAKKIASGAEARFSPRSVEHEFEASVMRTAAGPPHDALQDRETAQRKPSLERP